MCSHVNLDVASIVFLGVITHFFVNVKLEFISFFFNSHLSDLLYGVFGSCSLANDSLMVLASPRVFTKAAIGIGPKRYRHQSSRVTVSQESRRRRQRGIKRKQKLVRIHSSWQCRLETSLLGHSFSAECKEENSETTDFIVMMSFLEEPVTVWTSLGGEPPPGPGVFV